MSHAKKLHRYVATIELPYHMGGGVFMLKSRPAARNWEHKGASVIWHVQN